MKANPRDIAVIGISLRVAGANSKEQFWQNLLQGRDCLRRRTERDLRQSGESWRLLRNERFIRVFPAIDFPGWFDAEFFDIPPYEAEQTAASHRHFLECALEAFEDAAVVPGNPKHTIGVFAGADASYFDQQAMFTMDPVIRVPHRVGGAPDFLTARVSYRLNLTGPSFTVLSACATSLTAVDLGCSSLRKGECDIALVGGSDARQENSPGCMTGVEGMLSETGRIRPFDAAADGTIFGRGLGAVVLRRLPDAIREGNPIYAVIKGTAVTNDGDPDSKNTFIAPAVEGQLAAILAALSDAGIGAESIGHVEAHGTGTLLGDPIEVESLSRAFGEYTDQKGYCALGSAKANIGHLGPASGVVSFIKACLAVSHGAIPPVANFSTPNPRIDFETSAAYVPRTAIDWHTEPAVPRRASVSSFGFGGSNVHVVIEQAPRPGAVSAAGGSFLFPVSAKSNAALRRRIEDLGRYLEQDSENDLAAIERTLKHGRIPMQRRALLRAEEGSHTFALEKMESETVPVEGRPVVLLFPGQGAQQAGMGRELYFSDTAYRQVIDECAILLAPELGLDLREVLGYSNRTVEDTGTFTETEIVQPTLFITEYALAKLLISRGVEPGALLGHSVGELVAACIAGVFSLEDGLRLIVARGQLMQSCAPGQMAAVFIPANDVEFLLPDGIELAAVNAPDISVVSGSGSSMAALLEELENSGIAYTELRTSHGFHSYMMEPILDEFRECVRSITLSPPSMPVFSNVSGERLGDQDATDPDYWVRQIRRPVLFSNSVRYLLSDQFSQREPVFIEVGPGTGLSDLVKRHDKNSRVHATLVHADNSTCKEPSSADLIVGRLWCDGVKVNWPEGPENPMRTFARLPVYPFQRNPISSEEASKNTHEGLYVYQPTWSDAPLERELESGSDAQWLLLSDGSNLAEALVSRFDSAIVVEASNRCEIVQNGVSLARPGSERDLGELLEYADDLSAGRSIKIIHLWLQLADSDGRQAPGSLDEAMQHGFYTVLELCKSAMQLNIAERVSILSVASGIAAIDGEQSILNPSKATILGPFRVLPQEFPGLSFRCIDVDPTAIEAPGEGVVHTLLNELSESDADQRLVAIRQGRRLVEDLSLIEKRTVSSMRLRDGGTVLVTGGGGGLGLKVAEMLFESSGANIILGVRWQPPGLEGWEAASQEGGRKAHALRTVKSLRERGARIELIQMDMGEYESVRTAIKDIDSRFGGLRGVVHTAGAVEDGAALTKSRDTVDRVMNAKARGALFLRDILRDRSLDLFVLFSSQAAWRPGPGRIDYAAANAVLDLIARQRSRNMSGLSCSIGWGAWLETGMAYDLARNHDSSKNSVATDMKPAGATRFDFPHPVFQYGFTFDNGSRSYCGRVEKGRHWMVDEHRIDGRCLLSGTTLIELVYTAFRHNRGEIPAEITNLGLLRPLYVDGTMEIKLTFNMDGEKERFELESRKPDDDAFELNVVGYISHLDDASNCLRKPDDAEFQNQGEVRKRNEFLDLGPRWVKASWFGECGEWQMFRFDLPDKYAHDLEQYNLHPALFDVGVGAVVRRNFPNPLPYSYGRIRIYSNLPGSIKVYGRADKQTAAIEHELVYTDDSDRVLMEVEGYIVKDVSKTALLVPRFDSATARKLAAADPGDLDSLVWREVDDQEPADDEIKIEVIAAGLNFRDVLVALNQLPADARSARLGSECSGIVTAVGRNVKRIRVGDGVMAAVADGLSSRACVNASDAVIKPFSLSYSEAAGIPVTFLTVAYALEHLARLKEDESILIHAASGGVGLAAVQIARQCGARIFATAGRDEKREYLRTLGIECVMNSRSLDFVEEVREKTDGEGVDVVLNSLAGEYIDASLGILKRFGRFIELGKRDIRSGGSVDLAPFRNNLMFYAVDLGQMMGGDHPGLAEIFEDLADRFEQGQLVACPTKVYDGDCVADAFHFLARAHHIGKVVLKLRDDLDDSISYQDFKSRYGKGISNSKGVDQLKQLLSSDTTPPTVVVTAARLSEKARRSSLTTGDDMIGPSRSELDVEYRAPGNDTEIQLVKLFEDVLGVSPVGVDDDFVALGGDSISAIQIQHAVSRKFGKYLPLNSFLGDANVSGLAKFLADDATV